MYKRQDVVGEAEVLWSEMSSDLHVNRETLQSCTPCAWHARRSDRGRGRAEEREGEIIAVVQRAALMVVRNVLIRSVHFPIVCVALGVEVGEGVVASAVSVVALGRLNENTASKLALIDSRAQKERCGQRTTDIGMVEVCGERGEVWIQGGNVDVKRV